MSKVAKDFGSFVNDRAYDEYLNTNNSKFTEDDIADLFIQFTKSQQKAQLKTEDYVRTWIEEWCDLFPKGVRSGGKLIRSVPQDCVAKMAKFLKTYKYDRDLIFFATRAYLTDRRLDNYAYTRCATYFINKIGVGSELADWCDRCKDMDLKEEQVKYDIIEDEWT